MQRNPVATLAIASAMALAAFSSAACHRNNSEKAAPRAEIQSQSPVQQAAMPMTVTGCLRAGDAPDTFVLTASQAKEGEIPATYHLVGATGVNLTDHIGERIQVSGTMTAEQQATTIGLPTPAEKAKGTSGTPTVETKTQVDVRRLDVNSITPAGGRCDK